MVQAREGTEGGGRTKVEASKGEAKKQGSIGNICDICVILSYSILYHYLLVKSSLPGSKKPKHGRSSPSRSKSRKNRT